MSYTVLVKRIDEIINENIDDENCVIVLKGIPMDIVDNLVSINLEEIVKNKMEYFMQIYNKRKFLIYEEFLLLESFIVAQYKKVYILNNNIYMHQYPIYVSYSTEIRKGLLNHFMDTDDDSEDDIYIGDIEEYVALYNGLKEFNGYLIGSYCDEKMYTSNKIVTVNLFEDVNFNIKYTREAEEFVDIIEETDYIELVKKILEEPDEIFVRLSNYTGDANTLKKHLQIVTANWFGRTDVYQVQVQKIADCFEHRDDYGRILKEYWGYSDFRQLPIYDMQRLEDNAKEVIQISQENIISNIVQQVENCGRENSDFRDVFVTAPTGAGKSIMFQIPAIYLAEKYNLLTIVISPLIGLMNDQVKNLEVKNYKFAKTINSDISPIVKQDIMDKVADSQIHILYISPETLLSRSTVEQLIGDRTIGMIVIDEAHIVTTWGKQFRPDYWYLGDHIKKLRKNQIKNKECAFVISTFTATAIYHGLEDMYTETINSLHMLNPITYLGYVKRNDINIIIDKSVKNKGERSEYEYDKFIQIEEVIKRAIVTNKKTLVYFPTVALINRCYEYFRTKHKIDKVAVYHGSLSKDEKAENYDKFYNKEKLIMFATKAFGMGIDINDIELVVHFAPTGNVCDYVQEIGRAAREESLVGEAFYHYDRKDFKHINRLHGLSIIKRYQLVEVIKKIDELYSSNLQKNRRNFTRKRNAMLLDAENFTYIFGNPISDDDNSINKVKTALLIIQKDFENKIGFSPISVRPIPMFSIGFFHISETVQKRILKKYPDCLIEIEHSKHICRLMLDEIWRRDYFHVSFPKFKYMLYSKDIELDFIKEYTISSALCVSINYSANYTSIFKNVWDTLNEYIHKKVLSGKYTAISEVIDVLVKDCGFGRYKAQAICEVVIASMDAYRKNFARSTVPIVIERTTLEGQIKYQFNVAVDSYFQWVKRGYNKIISETVKGELYLINNSGNKTKEISIILGILEALDVLSFEMLGGANSQLYIYVNQIQAIKNILNAPYSYNNRLLNTISERHLISVKMLTYIYEGNFSNREIWDLFEDYFLGKIPNQVKNSCLQKKSDMDFD